MLYKENLGTGTPIPITPEMERVKHNQENLSSVLERSGGERCHLTPDPNSPLSPPPSFASNGSDFLSQFYVWTSVTSPDAFKDVNIF